jgi:hypothetical protein
MLFRPKSSTMHSEKRRVYDSLSYCSLISSKTFPSTVDAYLGDTEKINSYVVFTSFLNEISRIMLRNCVLVRGVGVTPPAPTHFLSLYGPELYF